MSPTPEPKPIDPAIFAGIDLADLYRFMRAFEGVAAAAVEELSADLAFRFGRAVEIAATRRPAADLEDAVAKFLIGLERGQIMHEEEFRALVAEARALLLEELPPAA